MLSPIKVITAGALVFAIGGVMLVAQPFEQPGSGVPGAATDDPALAPSFFTGTLGDWTEVAVPVRERREDGVVEYTDGIFTFPWDANDPRISGMATMITNEADYREGATTLASTEDIGVIRTGLLNIVNDEGSWEGQFSNLQLVTGSDEFFEASAWLTGSGAYEGLSAYVLWTLADDSLHGHITAEGPPPVPESLPEG